MKLFKYLSLITVLAALTACQDDSGEIIPQGIQIIKSEVSFTEKGGNGFVEVDKDIHSAYATSSWVNVSTSARTINLSVDANTESRESRNARLIIKASANDSIVVGISQSGITFGFFNANFDKIPYKGATYRMEGESSLDITVKECPDWIHFNRDEKGFDIVVDPTTTSNDRKATVKLASSNYEIAYDFMQYGSFNFKASNKQVVQAGDSIVLVGNANADITATVTGGEWLKVEPVEEGYLVVVDKNTDYKKSARTATVNLACDSYKANFKFTQEAINWGLKSGSDAVKEIVFVVEKEDTIVNKYTIDCNLACDTIYSNATWLDIELKDKNLTLSCHKDSAAAALLYFGFYTGTEDAILDSIEISALNDPDYFSFSATTPRPEDGWISIKDEATRLRYFIDFKGKYTVSSSAPSWLSASFDATNGVLAINAAANENGDFRNGKIYIKGESVSDTISVTQFDWEQNFFNKKAFLYYIDEDEEENYENIVLGEDGFILPDYISFAGDGVVWKVPYEIDYENGLLLFRSRKHVGDFKGAYELQTLAFSGTSLLNAPWMAAIEYSAEDNGLIIDMVDTGVLSAAGFTFDGFSLCAFDEGTFAGTLLSFNSPLIYIPSAAKAAPARRAKANFSKQAKPAPALKSEKGFSIVKF